MATNRLVLMNTLIVIHNIGCINSRETEIQGTFFLTFVNNNKNHTFMPIAFFYDYYFLTRQVHNNKIITQPTDHHRHQITRFE